MAMIGGVCMGSISMGQQLRFPLRLPTVTPPASFASYLFASPEHKRLSALTAPPGKLQGIATYYREIRDIAIYNGSRLDKGCTANGQASHDGAVRAKLGPLTHESRTHLGNPLGSSPYMLTIYKLTARSADDFIFKNNPGIQAGIIKYLYMIPQQHPRSDADMATNTAKVPYHRISHNMAKVQNAGMLPNLTGCIYPR
jgi:hypothetical protein